MRKDYWTGVNHTGLQGSNPLYPKLLPLYRLIFDRYRQDHPYEEAQVGNFSAPVPSFYIQDHLGNTRVTYEMDCGPQGARRNLEYVGDYLPYGGILREHIVDRRERFLTTEHERDEQTQLDYRGARFSDSRWGVFMSVDPLASEFPSWSPYSYTSNNPIRFIDPDGRMAVDALTPPGDYYDRQGNYLGNDGLDDNRIFLVNDGVSAQDLGLNSDPFTGSLFSSVRDKNTTEVGGLMILDRTSETPSSTNGEMQLIGRNGTDNVFTLEPGGPETKTPNLNRRIPDGVYNVDRYASKRYPDNFILSNNDVSQNRRILLHSGNTSADTRGCILPGCNPGNGTVGDSRNAMNTIRTFFNENNTSIIDRRDDIRMITRTNINN